MFVSESVVNTAAMFLMRENITSLARLHYFVQSFLLAYFFLTACCCV